MIQTDIYQRKRDFTVCGTVGLCAMKREEFVRELFSLPVSPVSATVNFVGVPAVISAKEDVELADIYNNATINAIDGMPLVRTARKFGLECERCAGPDVMGPVLAESVKQGKTHYFYGGKDDTVLAQLRERLEVDYPGIKIVGMYAPPFRDLTEKEDANICSEINELAPDFVWVGLGAPKQERWIYEHREKIHNTVLLGVGAAFNFFAGTLAKAPQWIESAGLEWAFRLAKEPKRLWKRYVIGGFKYVYYSAEAKIKHLDIPKPIE